MKNFKLNENEEFKVSFDNVVVFANNNKFILTVFLTNKRLVLLQDINKKLDFNSFLNAKGISVPSDLEIIYEIKLSDIDEVQFYDEVNHVFLKNTTNKLKILCEDLNKYLH